MGACVICTTTYNQLNALNVIKFIPLNSQLINNRLLPILMEITEMKEMMMKLKALVASVFKGMRQKSA